MMKKIVFILIVFAVNLQMTLAGENRLEVIDFPNIPEIPVPAGIGYEGYFKQHQPVKLVFGVSDPGQQFKESLANAAYTIKYLKPRGIKYEIQLVLYGRAVLPANSFNEEYAGYSALMDVLREQGVEFAVCNNSLAALGQAAEDIYPYMKIVPAGILQIVKKQMQGFAYIHNTK